MSQGDFLKKSDEDAWNFLEELSEKTMQWETFTEKPISTPTNKNGMHTLENSIAAEAKMTVVMRRLDALEIKEPDTNQVKQISSPTCNHCQASTHILEECPLLAFFFNNQEQINDVFQRQNNPWGSTYNPGWKNHPNFSWSQGGYQGGQAPN